MSFWLDQESNGLRLDAIPYLIEREGTSNEEPARDPRRGEAHPQGRRRALRGSCCLPKPISGPRTCATISETVTNAYGVSFSTDAAHCTWRSRRRTATRSWKSWNRRPTFPPCAVGDSSCAITMSSRWRWSRARSVTTCYQMFAADPRARLKPRHPAPPGALLENDPEASSS